MNFNELKIMNEHLIKFGFFILIFIFLNTLVFGMSSEKAVQILKLDQLAIPRSQAINLH